MGPAWIGWGPILIRYVSIFFLFALSIFFFTAARSAPVVNGDEPAAAASLQGEVIDHHALHDGTAFDHNRSVMRVYPHEGVIAYDEPKSAVRDVVRSGTVLFRGLKFTEGDRIEGTAFAFKKGCPPAPYAVTGSYSRDNATITLRGAGPIRKGCDVVGYSEKSPHAVLRFKSMISADDYGDI